MLRDDGCGSVCLKRWLAGDELIEHATKRIEIGSRCNLAAERLFRRHVSKGADHQSVLRQPRAIESHRESEVANLRDAGGRKPNVARLQVAVNDSLGVCEGETPRHTFRDLQGSAERERAARLL